MDSLVRPWKENCCTDIRYCKLTVDKWGIQYLKAFFVFSSSFPSPSFSLPNEVMTVLKFHLKGQFWQHNLQAHFFQFPDICVRVCTCMYILFAKRPHLIHDWLTYYLWFLTSCVHMPNCASVCRCEVRTLVESVCTNMSQSHSWLESQRMFCWVP